MAGKSYHLTTFGCQMNEHDSERMKGMLESLGYSEVPDRDGAEAFWGGYTALFLDPDGHPWEVAHNPHWTVREDGTVALG